MAKPDATIEKKPGEDFSVGFTPEYPDLPTSGTIVAVSATVTPASAGLTLQGTAQINGTATGVYQRVQAGTNKTDYIIRFAVTFSDGKVLYYDYRILVRD